MRTNRKGLLWTDGEWADLAAHVKAGLSDYEIAQQMGRPTFGVTRQRQQLVWRTGFRPYSPAETQRVITLLAAGWKQRRIAAEIGRKPNSVHGHVFRLRARHLLVGRGQPSLPRVSMEFAL